MFKKSPDWERQSEGNHEVTPAKSTQPKGGQEFVFRKRQSETSSEGSHVSRGAHWERGERARVPVVLKKTRENKWFTCERSTIRAGE